MNTYFSTFIPGLGEVVKQQLSQDLQNFTATTLLDGLVIYKSSSQIEAIKKLHYLNNSFLSLNLFEKLLDQKPIENIANKILKSELPEIKVIGKTFRIMFYFANEPTSVSKPLLTKLEDKFRSKYKLTVDRTNPQQEFWISYRKEGLGLVGLRITKHPDWKKVLQKGELRPELASLLSVISEVSAEDIVLDPFAGSGAIEKQRKFFPYKTFISSDIAPSGKSIRKIDATNLSNSLGVNCISKIITDPPWGVSVGKELNLNDFYKQMLGVFSMVLKTKGLAIVLMGNKELFETILEKENRLKLLEKYDILVSGKKASIYKLVKL